MNKLIGIIGLDMVLIFIPFLIGVAPDLVLWISYTLIGIKILAILSVLFSNVDKVKKTIVEERSDRPYWWNIYDVLSDIVFCIVWIIYGFYALPLLLIIFKLLVTIKIPSYWNRDE